VVTVFAKAGGVEEIALRFVLGGVIVTAFAALGEPCQPKSLAGIFGAAPSVALVTLTLAFVRHGGATAATESRWMIAGAIAFVAYCTASRRAVERHGIPVWIGALACWAAWLAIAFGIWMAVRWLA
jgi:hypothetical protein